jgi:arginyl-tRNA synthetase
MKKKDLILFIDKVEQKAIKSVKERYEKLIEEEKIKILKEKDYAARINKVQRKVNDLFSEAQDLVLDMKEDITVRYEYYYDIAKQLSSFTGKDRILENVKYNGKFDGGSVQLIRNECERELEAVKDNYKKVRVVVDSFTSANKIAEYLKELGFDLSSLEKQECTALVCEIDKTKLFVCGENK